MGEVIDFVPRPNLNRKPMLSDSKIYQDVVKQLRPLVDEAMIITDHKDFVAPEKDPA